MKSADQASEAQTHDAIRRAHPPGDPASTGIPNQFRLLMWDEVVRRGDFVADECQGFDLWEGPTGFRAGSYVTPIYRRDGGCSTTGKK